MFLLQIFTVIILKKHKYNKMLRQKPIPLYIFGRLRRFMKNMRYRSCTNSIPWNINISNGAIGKQADIITK